MTPSAVELIREAAPEPWFAWLLAALVRQVVRQRWLVNVVDEHLRDEDGMPAADAGEIPGLPGHRYDFHGIGCSITLPDGEVVDVDFHGDGGLTVDPYFFTRRLESLENPEIVERRVIELLPAEDLVIHALVKLRARGVLWHRESQHVFRLPRTLEALASENVISGLRAEWAALDDDDHAEAYVAFLREAVPTAPSALKPLAWVLPPGEVVVIVDAVLRGPIVPGHGFLVDALEGVTRLPRIDSVAELLDRLDEREHHPLVAHAVLFYLLRRGIRPRECVHLLLRFAAIETVPGYLGNPLLGRFAVLALEHREAHPHALAIVRRALGSNTPIVRHEVTAALLALGHRWCMGELAKVDVTVVEGVSDVEVKALRARLRGVRDELAQLL